jgi:Zn finger protein HypA/HybF involved in hydrogenase expression
MTRLFHAALVLVGVLFAALGLLFLVASAGSGRRLAVAVAALGVGGVLAGLGVRGLKALARSAPEAVRAEILAEAGRRSGSLSATEIAALLGERGQVGRDVLAALEAEGVCRRHWEQDAELYLFPGMQPRLAVRRCDYCGSELPLDDETSSCPKCGGTVKTAAERLSVRRDDAYRMDS